MYGITNHLVGATTAAETGKMSDVRLSRDTITQLHKTAADGELEHLSLHHSVGGRGLPYIEMHWNALFRLFSRPRLHLFRCSRHGNVSRAQVRVYGLHRGIAFCKLMRGF